MLPLLLAVDRGVTAVDTGATAVAMSATAAADTGATAVDSTSTARLSAPPPPDVEVTPRLRTGLVVGLELGLAMGAASGYPNAASQIGDPRYYSASGFMGGSTGTLFIMGAIADYLNFGFWFGSTNYRSGDWRSSGGGAGLRVEAFPLIRLVPALAGLGFVGNFGVGSGSLISTKPNEPEARGTQSIIGFGPFYEWSFGHFLGGHFGAGPSLEVDAVWSRPFEQHGLLASGRVVFYGGP